MRRMLCPPAAATSSALLADAWLRTSEKSTALGAVACDAVAQLSFGLLPLHGERVDGGVSGSKCVDGRLIFWREVVAAELDVGVNLH